MTCRGALRRLGVATPAEVRSFCGGMDLADAKRRCEEAAARGEAVPVEVPPADGGRPVRAFAVADYEARLAGIGGAPPRTRLLSPFDPVVRDRKRLLRLFGYDLGVEPPWGRKELSPWERRQWRPEDVTVRLAAGAEIAGVVRDETASRTRARP